MLIRISNREMLVALLRHSPCVFGKRSEVGNSYDKDAKFSTLLAFERGTIDETNSAVSACVSQPQLFVF